MLFIHEPGKTTKYRTDKQVLKAGWSCELYVYRAPRPTAPAIAGAFVLASLAFLLYAVFSKIDDLWIYAAVSTGVTVFLTLLAVYISLTMNYERISLAGSFAHAYACQHSLLVIRQKGRRPEAWFSSGFVFFMHDREAHLYTSADFSRLDLNEVAAQDVRVKSRMATALRRRSFVLTDSTDLRDYLRCVAAKNKLLLARKAGLVKRSA